MRNPKAFAVVLIVLTFLLSVIFVQRTIVASPEIYVRVDPEDTTAAVGEDFTIEVVVENVPVDPGTAGIEFKLSWNASILSVVSMEEVIFHTVTPEEEWGNIWGVKHELGVGNVRYAYTWMNLTRALEMGYAPISGNGTVATITFSGIMLGETSLHFELVKVCDPEGIQMPFTSFDGYAEITTCSPTAEFTWIPTYPYVNESVTFNASASLPGWDGDTICPITEYRWDFNGDSVFDVNATEPIINHTYTQLGSYAAFLEVYAPGIPPNIDPTYNGSCETEIIVRIQMKPISVEAEINIEDIEIAVEKTGAQVKYKLKFSLHLKQQNLTTGRIRLTVYQKELKITEKGMVKLKGRKIGGTNWIPIGPGQKIKMLKNCTKYPFEVDLPINPKISINLLLYIEMIGAWQPQRKDRLKKFEVEIAVVGWEKASLKEVADPIFQFVIPNPSETEPTDVYLDIYKELPPDWTYIMEPAPKQVYSLPPNGTMEGFLTVVPPPNLPEGQTANITIVANNATSGITYLWIPFRLVNDYVSPQITSTEFVYNSSKNLLTFFLEASDMPAGINRAILHYSTDNVTWSSTVMDWMSGDWYGPTTFNVTIAVPLDCTQLVYDRQKMFYYYFTVIDDLWNINSTDVTELVFRPKIIIGDLNCDGTVDVFDAVILAGHAGETDP